MSKTVKAGDIQQLTNDLSRSHINGHFKDGKTMLISAIEEGNQQMVHYLLQTGAKVTEGWKKQVINPWAPDILTEGIIYPLQMAIECDAKWAVQVLLEYGARAEQCNEGLVCLLQRAVKWNAPDIITHLLNTVKEDDQFGVSNVVSMATFGPVLMTAVYDSNIDMVNLLVKMGVSVNTVTDNMLPLTVAAYLQDLQMCICLIRNGARLIDVDQSTFCQPNPLAFAIQAGWVKAMEFLLNLGAFPDSPVSWNNMVYTQNILDSGSRLLHLAVAKRSLPMVKILVEMKANVSLTDSSGNTALHVACKDQEMPLEIIDYLINCNVNIGDEDNISMINAKNKQGLTPLMLCCRCGVQPAAELLLKYNVNLNDKDSSMMTALHYAVRGGKENMVDCLLKSGAHFINAKRVSMLESAIRSGHEGITEMLLQQGADIHCLSSGKDTALHLAVQSKNHYLVEMLLDKGVNVNSVNEAGETALMLAAGSCDDDGLIVQTLDCYQNETALSMAAFFGRVDNARILISEGADLLLSEQRHTSPLYWSICHNHLTILQMLLHAGAKFTLHDMASEKYSKSICALNNGDLCHWLVDHVTNVRSLQNLSALVIREQLKHFSGGMSIRPRVYCLPIPERLRSNVMLDNVELLEFNQDYEYSYG